MSAPRRIAVVGAGLAGLACARALHEAGQAVTLFDRGAEPGGRCTTLRTPAGPVDHGLPWLTAASEGFDRQLHAWADAGWLTPDSSQPRRWMAQPSMQSLPARLAEGLMFAGRLEIAAVERDGAHWRLRPHEAPPFGLDLHFDAVVIAMPPEQSAPLLAADPALADAMRGVRSEPCWAVTAAWPVALPIRQDEWHGASDVLQSARRDDHRPGRARTGTRWVLHANAYWSANNLDVRETDVVKRLLDAFAGAAGVRLARPSHAAAHLWRHAQVLQPREEPCGWNAELRIGACGDAWHALEGEQGAERAWLSGLALARQMLAATP